MTLRGRMPVVDAPPRGPVDDNPASTVAVVALLSLSMLVMAVALFNRHPQPPRPPGREFSDGRRNGRGRWHLRLGLAALGLLIAWLLAVVVLNRLGFGPDAGRIGTPPDLPDEVTPSAPTTPSSAPPAKHGDMYRFLMATTAVLVMMTVLGMVLTALRRPLPEAAAVTAGDSVGSAGPEPLAVAAERGLAEVENLQLEPREAIIACYAAMERALSVAPGAAPHASDTPSEVLARAVDNGALSRGNASELVALFTEARYSTHLMTEEHRRAAQVALRAVLGELHSDSVSPS